MLGAVMFGHESFQPVIEAIIELAEHAAKEPWPLPEPPAEEAGARGAGRCAGPRPRWPRPISERDKQAPPRQGRRGQAERRRGCSTAEGLDAEKAQGPVQGPRSRRSCAAPSSTPACASTAATPRRCGRSSPRSASCRARTARRCSPAARRRRWCVATLGTGQDEQIIDALEGEYREHFMLHYNFPPYSVGEAGRMGSPGPPRDRPRQARLARDPAAAAGEGQVPLHDPRRLRDHREQRLVLDGDGLRRARWR